MPCWQISQRSLPSSVLTTSCLMYHSKPRVIKTRLRGKLFLIRKGPVPESSSACGWEQDRTESCSKPLLQSASGKEREKAFGFTEIHKIIYDFPPPDQLPVINYAEPFFFLFLFRQQMTKVMMEIPQWHCLRYFKHDVHLMRRCRNYRQPLLRKPLD